MYLRTRVSAWRIVWRVCVCVCEWHLKLQRGGGDCCVLSSSLQLRVSSVLRLLSVSLVSQARGWLN